MSVIVTCLYRYVHPPITGMMIYKSSKNESDKSGFRWKDLDEVSKTVPLAFIAAEDQNFFNHYGFDIEAIKAASKYNEKKGSMRGASTISQQVAKNLFLFPTRSFLRKGVEAYFTILIELLWPKCRIIEMYINIVELGPEIYGIEQASQKYFGKPSSRLSTADAALIATALPNPIHFKLTQPSPYMYKEKTG